MAEEKAVAFSQSAAERIARVVQKVEKSNPAFQSVPRGAGPVGRDGEFYAVLTDRSGHKYSWTKLEAQDEGAKALEENESWGTGDCEAETGYAVDVFKSENVPKQTIVRLRPAPGMNWYLFEIVAPAWRGITTSSVGARTGIGKDGHGLANIYATPEDDTTEPEVVDENVKVYNSADESVSSGKQVQLKYVAGRLYVDVEDC